MTNPIKARMASVALLAVLAGGCESFLDVNENPNAPENARVDVRLPAVVAGMVHSTYYGDPPLWAVEWTQQTSYNNDTRAYDEIHFYEVQDNSPDGWWNFYFAGMLNETKLMMQETDPETDAAYHGIAKFIHAWTWALTTDLWGPVPFTEALDPANPTAPYDDQRVVYEAVDRWFEEAVADMRNPAATRTPGAGDLLFEGDMARWVKLARVVQARHHLRLSSAPWEDRQARAQAALDALQEGFTSNADDADFEYPGEDDARNPLWLFQDRGDLFKASEFVVELLKGRDDPRLPIMVMPALADLEAGQTVYRGHRNGTDGAPDSTLSRVGELFTAEGATLNVASYSDAKFTEAEARLIVSGAGAADEPYRAGIRASMEKMGVASADIEAYLAARPPLSSVADPLEEIITEKYVANYLKIEPWNDWRRTGYPMIEPVDGRVISGIPVRIRTPAAELSNNSANVLATGVPTGLDGMLWKSADVWWGGN
jgi:hypothetical protein